MTKITITDRFIYSYIDGFTKNDKPVFASNKHIAEQINRSESIVSHSISRLLKLGLLENKGNKYARQLYTKGDLVTADFSITNADFNQSTAKNSISYDEIMALIAENSVSEELKSAVANAENSYILIKLLLSYKSKKKEIYKEKKEPPQTRGTRLPEDWTLELELGRWAMSMGLTRQEVLTEADKFKNYWHALAGARAVKKDWDKTFKNWIYTALERKSK